MAKVVAKFIIKKDVFLCLGIEYGVEAYRMITPQMHYVLELDDDGRVWLAKPREQLRLPVKESMDMVKPGMFKMIKYVKG